VISLASTSPQAQLGTARTTHRRSNRCAYVRCGVASLAHIPSKIAATRNESDEKVCGARSVLALHNLHNDCDHKRSAMTALSSTRTQSVKGDRPGIIQDLKNHSVAPTGATTCRKVAGRLLPHVRVYTHISCRSMYQHVRCICDRKHDQQSRNEETNSFDHFSTIARLLREQTYAIKGPVRNRTRAHTRGTHNVLLTLQPQPLLLAAISPAGSKQGPC
jgi:hypothetical protein